ncbi:hypothetical protein [Streptomyces sp. NPDC088270]|uniref:hypothetical protein n=1 Tax=unclassified Streptomyces TaxID=2593676 RepID=UPI0034434898
MPRYEFGAGVADFVVAPSDGTWAVGALAPITFWDAVTDGGQYTDLLDGASSPITQVVSDEHGALPRFLGPPDITGMWADAGGGTRAWMDAHSVVAGGSSDQSVSSVNGQVGVVQLTASDVGAAATVHTHTPAQVGAIPAADRGAAGGIATLDASGVLTAAQRPARASSRSAVIPAAAAGTWAVWQAPRAVTITGVRGIRTGGTAATINARRGADDLLATDLSLTTADTWLSGPAVQNTAVAAGDSVAVSVRSAAGAPTVTIQIDYQEA